ncbi:Uncharacterised protein [Chlamydia abortus]|nr:Uncharacterised protein [Chlamydia abortus]
MGGNVVFGAENGTRGRKCPILKRRAAFWVECCLLAREVGFGGGTGTECHLFCWEKSGLLLEKASYFRLNGGTVGERMS